MRAEGYSILLMPEGETFKRYAKVIGDLSQRHGTPNFEPHVTLLGGIPSTLSKDQVEVRVQQVASSLLPFDIILSGYGMEDFYFRALFLFAIRTPSLTTANKRAQEIFQSSGHYVPHLSLIYGDIAIEEKELIIQGLDLKLPDQFEVGSLHLWQNEGEVKDWRKVAEFPLSREH